MVRSKELLAAIIIALISVAAFAQETSPKALLVDYPLKIYLTGTGSVDLVYSAPEAQTISLYAKNLTPDIDVDTMLEVFAPDGTSLAFNDDLTAGSGDPGIEDLSLPEAGVYVVRLDTFTGGARGGVEVSVITSKSDEGGLRNLGDLMNNQNSEGSASLDVTDTLDSSGRTAYEFDGAAGQVINVQAEAISPADLDLQLVIFGPDGSQVEGGYDDDSGANAGLGDSDPAIMGLRLPLTGVYRVEVRSWFSARGDFRLVIEEAQ